MLIDIDNRPDVGVELDARVEADAAGAGVIVPAAAQRWLRELKALIGEDVRIILRRWKKRTAQQNRYLWGVVYAVLLDGLRKLALEAGEVCPFDSDEDCHAAMKHRFLGISLVTFLGESIELPPSTAKLSTVQFSAYVEAIARWAASIGIFIPPPNYEEAA
jgi:hypothetical protein